jgi:hypothetical protein
MVINDIFEIVEKHIASYSRGLLTGLAKPSSLGKFRIAPEPESILSAEVFSFVLLNTVLGATVSRLIPGRPELKETITVCVVLLLLWLCFGILLHGICLLLRGGGSFVETISASLRVFSLAYLISTFLAFLWLLVVRAYPFIPELLSSVVWPTLWFWSSGYQVVFLLQFVVLVVYLPPAVQRVHRFSVAGNLVGILAAFLTLFVGLPIFLVGGC